MALGRGRVYTGRAGEQRLLPVSLSRSRAKVIRTQRLVKVTLSPCPGMSENAAGATRREETGGRGSRGSSILGMG